MLRGGALVCAAILAACSSTNTTIVADPDAGSGGEAGSGGTGGSAGGSAGTGGGGGAAGAGTGGAAGSSGSGGMGGVAAGGTGGSPGGTGGQAGDGGAGGQGGASDSLLDYTAGTFVRPSEASYRTSASTLAWAGIDEMRFEDRGNGPELLLEGGANNEIPTPEALENWSFAPDTPDLQIDAQGAPDGEQDADAYVNLSGGRNRPARVALADPAPRSASIWCRRGTGSTAQVAAGSVGAGAPTLFTPGSNWARYDNTVRDPSNAIIQVANHQGSGPVGGVAGETHWWWGAQVESGTFPTSYVRDGLRAADVLTFASYPTRLTDGAWQVDAWPAFASTETDDPSRARFVLFSFGGADNLLQIRADRVEVVAGGSVVIQTDPITWGRHDLMSIELDPSAGLLFAAATTSSSVTGSAWTWPASGALRVGGEVGGTAEWSGRLGAPQRLP